MTYKIAQLGIKEPAKLIIKMLSELKKLYKNEQFNPKLMGVFVRPDYLLRRGLYKIFSELSVNLSGNLLDVGCGAKPYQDLFDVDKYIGLEIDDKGDRNHKYADEFYDGKKMPFSDNSFDSVFSSEVLEHVFNPNEFLREINRVTKDGGMLLMSVPFTYREHEQPYDFGRYTSFGLKYILSENGFEVVECRKSVNGIWAILQLLIIYLVNLRLVKNKYFNLIIALIFMIPINIAGLVLSKVSSKDNDIYLNNIILAKKIKDIKE